MITYGTRVSGDSRRRALGDLGEAAPYYKAEWMETGRDPVFSPICFLIEQPAGSVLPTHFHRRDEFQVVVQGYGSIGQHDLRPVSIHYAGAYTGYGPVTAGPEGLAYFTLRPAFDTKGAITLEHARTEMVRGPKRQDYADHLEPATAEQLCALAKPEYQDLLPRAADGLRVLAVRVPPGQRIDLEPAEGCLGVFHMLVAGDASISGKALERWETAFASADEPAMDAVAGPQGVLLVSMYMPVTAPEYVGITDSYRPA